MKKKELLEKYFKVVRKMQRLQNKVEEMQQMQQAKQMCLDKIRHNYESRYGREAWTALVEQCMKEV